MANQQQDQHHQEHDHNIGNCETTNEIDYLKSIENATIIIKERLIAKSKDSSSLEGGKAAGLWNVFSGLADKSFELALSCKDELSSFVTELTEEVSEVYRENLKEPVTQLTMNIPPTFSSLKSESIILHDPDKGDRLNESSFPLEENIELTKEWSKFESSPRGKAQFGPLQQSIILSNDENLKGLFATLVPTRMDSESFWKRWRYWHFLQSTLKNGEGEEEEGEADWVKKENDLNNPEPFTEAVNISYSNLCEGGPIDTVQNLKKDFNGDEDWDDWE